MLASLKGKIPGIHKFISYLKYLKVVKSNAYLRGIYDELIRFCKFYNFKECDEKLIRFNEKRKLEKKTPKEEREFFFKEFGDNIMDVVNNVKDEILPKMKSRPKDTLLRIKMWSNCLKYKKGTDEVKEIKTEIENNMNFFFDD